MNTCDIGESASVGPFETTFNGSKIAFGPGISRKILPIVQAIGGSRCLIVTTPGQAATADRVAHSLGKLAVGVFSGAAAHTPVNVTQHAMSVYFAVAADCVVALGGGSAIGLGKAIAYRTGAPLVALPTTYAGSEVTPVLGQTRDGIKSTIRYKSVLPQAVVYDPDLTLNLPVSVSITSGLNAMAHAAEALYARNKSPVTTMMALEGLRVFKSALPDIVDNPSDQRARAQALYGTWLCGAVLGAVDMALHHKLCHTIGGAFDLGHAETHAVLLPHTINYNEGAARNELAQAARLFGGGLGSGLHAFAAELGAPLTLKELGLTERDLDKAAELAAHNPYWNPRDIERHEIRALLGRAWAGQRPN